jgi:hypothetical protein
MEAKLSETKRSSDAGWSYDEQLLHIAPSEKQRRLLLSYMFSLNRGPDAVHQMILADVTRLQELGAQKHVEDLKVVLARFVTEFLPNGSEC